MSKTYTKDEAIALKKKGFKSLNSLLESFIANSSPDGKDFVKKAALISKWLHQYAGYVSFEKSFDPKKNISYKRGDIVFVNFGFNVGTELGGEHYAVILDKVSDHASSTVTVVPLTSLKLGKPIHPNDVFLGNELFEKLHLKFKTVLPQLREMQTNNSLMLDLVKEKLSKIESSDTNSDELNELITEFEQKTKELTHEIEKAERLKKEILSLKQGSIAKVQQITTISKIRIYNPKYKSDPLYGIRFSDIAMDKINEKIKEFYVF